MEIFKLTGSIMVDSNAAQESLSKTGEQAEGVGSKLMQGIGTAAKWAAGITAAAIAVGKAMLDAARDTAEELDLIDKASIRMGITAESYQELAYAAGLCGVEMSTLEKAAKKLEGTDMNLEDALAGLMAIEDETERTQAAIEMFGESIAYQMTPLLQQGAEGMDAMVQEANDLGLIMSQDTVSAGASMNDMFSKIDQSIDTLKNSLMADLMPYLMDVLQFIIDEMPEIKEIVGNLADSIMPIIQPVFDFIVANLPNIISTVKRTLEMIMPIVEPILSAVLGVVQGLFQLLNGDTEGFVETIKTTLLNLGTALFDVGKSIMQSLWDGFKQIWTNLSNWVQEKTAWIKNMFSSAKDEAGNTDGSHAAGLPYVPYDGYSATLHRGEMVLTAADAANYRNGNTGNGSGITIVQNISATPMTPVELAAATQQYFTQARWALA